MAASSTVRGLGEAIAALRPSCRVSGSIPRPRRPAARHHQTCLLRRTVTTVDGAAAAPPLTPPLSLAQPPQFLLLLPPPAQQRLLPPLARQASAQQAPAQQPRPPPPVGHRAPTTPRPAPGQKAPRQRLADARVGTIPDHPSVTTPVPVTVYQFPSMRPAQLELWSPQHLAVPMRKDLLHLAVVHEGSCTRQGTASTKTRWEVHGSHRKVRPQKGTGRARAGWRQSPIFRGGGKTFGPHPRDFGNKMNSKMYDRAWRVALSHRYRNGELVVVEDGLALGCVSGGGGGRGAAAAAATAAKVRELAENRKLDVPMVDEFLAKLARETLARLGFDQGRTLFVAARRRPEFFEAMEKVPKRGRAIAVADVDIKDLLETRRVVVERSALARMMRDHQSDLESKVIFADGSRRLPPRMGQMAVRAL